MQNAEWKAETGGCVRLLFCIHHSAFCISFSMSPQRAVHHPPRVQRREAVLDGLHRLLPAGLGALALERLPRLEHLRLALLALALAVPVAELRGRKVLAVFL